MNITHFGDALDHWKGCIVQLLHEHLNTIHAIPMFTDENVAGAWTDTRLRSYAQTIQVDMERILHRKARFKAESRLSYFTDLGVAGDCDLFVDPDTGVAPASGGDARHIHPAELAVLLPEGAGRVVLIYQHSSREENWVEACLKRVTNHDHLQGCFAFAYCAGSASMIFVSRAPDRLSEMRSVLCRFNAVVPRVTAMFPEQPAAQ